MNCIEGGEEIEIITERRIGEAEPRITKRERGKKLEGWKKFLYLWSVAKSLCGIDGSG